MDDKILIVSTGDGDGEHIRTLLLKTLTEHPELFNNFEVKISNSQYDFSNYIKLIDKRRKKK